MKVLYLCIIIVHACCIFAKELDCPENSDCELKAATLQLSESLSRSLLELIEEELAPETALGGGGGDEEELAWLAARLSSKLSQAEALLRARAELLPRSPRSHINPCPFKSVLNTLKLNTPDPLNNKSKTIPKESEKLRDLHIKRHYFLSHIDYATDVDCARMFNSNLRYIYHNVVHPDPKLVIFVIDNSIDVDAMQYAINIIKEVSSILQDTDMFALKMTNSTEFVKFKDSCDKDGIADIGNATVTNKLFLQEYVSTIEMASSSISSVLIREELRVLLDKFQSPAQKLVIFLTDTKVLTDDSWLKIIPNPHKHYHSLKFVIGSINSSEIDRNSSLEILHFDKASNHSDHHSLIRIHINSSGVVGQIASAFISLLPQNYEVGKIKVLMPVWEAIERDFLVPLVLLMDSGILGLDLFWSDLAEDIIYFDQSKATSRAFVVDFSRRVIMHSFFPRPEMTTERIKFSYLYEIEQYDFIHDVMHQMFSTNVGSLKKFDSFTNRSLTYSWKWIEHMYIICTVSGEDNVNLYNVTEALYQRNPEDILFHRLDLFPPKSGKLCRHFKQLATLEQGTIYLSPSSFESPFTYKREAVQDARYIRDCVAYLGGAASGLLASPGPRARVRRDTARLAALLPHWRRRHLAGPRASNIVRRYAASPHGVLAMFPGTALEPDYEPARRPWFRHAARHRGRILLTAPALDVGGAGYVVTLALAPLRSDLVLALDLPLGYLEQLMVHAEPRCAAPAARCLVLDRRGHLAAHPALLAPRGPGPVERLHLAHAESALALDMLAHEHLVSKRRCLRLHDRTEQRYYLFNTSLLDVLGNAARGDHCLRYWVRAVPAAEALVALVLARCATVGAFCPCGMLDRVCLNCRRMERTECECPCECSVDCSPVPTALPPCEPPDERNDHKSHYFRNVAEALPPCSEPACLARTGAGGCLGVAGCAWCARGPAGPLPAPHCAPMAGCFGGELGAVTPYGEGPVREPAPALGGTAAAAAIGALLVSVAAYCCRRRRSPRCAAREALLPPPCAGAMAVSPRPAAPAPVAPAPPPPAPWPYRVAGGARRARGPAPGSDHGYCTMTPHDDSEAGGAVGADAAPLSDDAQSEASGPLPRAAPALSPPVLSAPALGSPLPGWRVLAPVTVHRHMEAS